MRILTFAMVILALYPVQLFAAAEDLLKNQEVASAIAVYDKWIQHTAREREQPGLSVGIVYDQELLWAKGYGYADLAKKTPATAKTLYRIASITKLFTATAIMQLRDAGKLQLDDPVAKHLAWFQMKDAHPDSPTVTIRHLLTHTSGIVRELEGLYWDDMKFPTREEMIRLIQNSPTALPRETDYKYSNVAFALLGEIVSAVSGEAYPEYIHKHILEPLQMKNTFVVPRPDQPDLAVGYEVRVPGKPRVAEPFTDLGPMSSLGNIATNIEDLARFVSLQFREGKQEGAQILKGSTIKEMHRVQWLEEDWTSGVGIAWHLSRMNDVTRIGHTGYVPGHVTAISAAPSEKVGVIVFTNAADGQPVRYSRKAWEIVAPAIQKAVEKKEEAKVPLESWKQYEGDYYGFDGAYVSVMIVNGELCLVDFTEENPLKDRIFLQPVSEHLFRMKEGFQEGETVRFELDKSGKPVRLVMPGYAYVRQ